MSGRVTAIDIARAASGDSTMLIGTDGGGLWRSVDFAGDDPAWEALTDNLPLPLSSIDRVGLLNVYSIAVDPNHSRVIYAATPAGLLKSIDHGATWSVLGRQLIARGLGFFKVIVDPTDRGGNVLYALAANFTSALRYGVYKSTDGGVTWLAREAGLPANGSPSDLAFVVVRRRRNRRVPTLYVAVVGQGIWTSTDGAATWQTSAVNLVDHRANDGAVDATSIGAISFGTDRGFDAGIGVFATVTNGNTAQAQTAFLLTVLSLDLGSGTWNPVNNGLPASMNLGSGSALGLAPDGTLYFGALGVYQSTDRGASWHSLATTIQPHVDHHAWMFNEGDVYAGNDGGIWRYRPASAGNVGSGVWSSLASSSLSTHLLNSVSASPKNPGVLVAGAQDNATMLRNAGVWTTPLASQAGQPPALVGGDVALVRFDPDPSTETIYSIPNPTGGPTFYRSDDAGKRWWDRSVERTAGVVVHGDAHTEAPAFAIDPASPNRVALGYSAVYESLDRGDTWSAASGLLDGTASRSTVSALAYDGTSLYAGYSSGSLFKRSSAWSAVLAPSHGTFGGVIADIAVDGPNVAYLAVANNEDPSGRVWQTMDGGATWKDLTGNLSGLAISAITVGHVHGDATSWLFVGTRVGVFYSASSGGCWARLGAGCPDVWVPDLHFDQRHHMLHAATYGRGAWFCEVIGLRSPSVKIVATGGAGAESLSYVAQTNGLTDAIPVAFAWKLFGVTASSPLDQPSITTGLPDNRFFAWISVSVTVDGCTIEDSIRLRGPSGGQGA